MSSRGAHPVRRPTVLWAVGRSVVGRLARLAALAATATAPAQLEPAVGEAVAIRGRTAVVEVRARGEQLPVSVELEPIGEPGGDPAASGSLRVPARIVWQYMPVPSEGSLLRWAAAANPLRVTDVRPPNAVAAFLLVEIPASAPDRLVLRLGARAVALSVFDRGDGSIFDRLAARASMMTPQGARSAALSLPDPAAPFERFRHAIGMPMRGWDEPPAFAVGSADEALARAHTEVWRAALTRIADSAAGPAVELAELLVATCADDTAPAPIAAWIANPDELRSILRLAFERDISAERLAAGVNELLRVRAPILWWIEDSDRTTVTLACANPTTRPQVVKYQWLSGSDDDVVPLGLAVPPAEVRRARVTRPTLARNPLAASEPGALERLRISCGGFEENATAPPAVLPVAAGGLDVREMVAPLNLAAVAAGRRGAPAVAGGSRVSVRERLAGWEVFVEAASLAPGEAIVACGARGGTVRIGDDGAATVEGCEVPADAVEFALYPGRVRASFFVPPEWIAREDDATIVEVGFRREFAAGFVDALAPTVPWRTRPRTVALDLSPRP